MDSNDPDPHDVPEAFDMYEEPSEYLDSAIDYSISDADNITTAPPPEPEEKIAVERQVDYLDLQGLHTLSDPVIEKTRIRVRVEQILPPACPECGCDTDLFKSNGTRRWQASSMKCAPPVPAR